MEKSSLATAPPLQALFGISTPLKSSGSSAVGIVASWSLRKRVKGIAVLVVVVVKNGSQTGTLFDATKGNNYAVVHDYSLSRGEGEYR